MNEALSGGEPDPGLLPSQVAVKILCEEIRATYPEFPSPYVSWATSADAEEVQERLWQSSLGDLVLPEGATLSAPPRDDREKGLDLFVGITPVTEVSVRGWVHDYSDVWSRQLDIVLKYESDIFEASQSLSAYLSGAGPGTLPRMSRNVRSSVYAEMGYEGHNYAGRDAKDEEEVLAFVGLARELFNQRVLSTRVIR